MKVLFEAVGSPGWPTLLPWLRCSFRTIAALEIDPFVARASLVDCILEVQPYSEIDDGEFLVGLCEQEGIDLVFPSVDEGLLLWDEQRSALAARNVELVLSPRETLEICLDKWKTYEFFRDHGIPTPATALEQEYEIVKPRRGRGGAGFRRTAPTHAPLRDAISQEQAPGQEISIDVLCDRDGGLRYCVLRERLETQSGISVRGRVVRHAQVERYVEQIVQATPFIGIANLQCFVEGDSVSFIEINPRIPGGLSLSLAATENWFDCWLKLRAARPIEPVPVREGLAVARHFADAFIDPPPPRQEREACPTDDASSSLAGSVPSTTSSIR
jgi:carbamoyl-phosphate synthase large subunit